MNNVNDWYSGWGWFIWIGIWFLFISSFGNWGYTYRAHRLYRGLSPEKTSLDILNQRYVNGEIKRDEFLQIKQDISAEKSRGKIVSNPKKTDLI